jgi:hypothetical protein
MDNCDQLNGGRMTILSRRLDGYNNISNRTISDYGNIPIKKLWIRRKPIFNILQKGIDIVSGGISKIQYDKLFHLSLIALLQNGIYIIMEKNEVVNVQPITNDNESQTEYKVVPLHNRRITVADLLMNARNHVGDKTFFEYDAFHNNCQYFIGYLLKYSHLLTPKLQEFFFQDLDKIIKNTPGWIQSAAKIATNTAATWNKISGAGKEQHENNMLKDIVKYKKTYKGDDCLRDWIKTKNAKKHMKILNI